MSNQFKKGDKIKCVNASLGYGQMDYRLTVGKVYEVQEDMGEYDPCVAVFSDDGRLRRPYTSRFVLVSPVVPLFMWRTEDEDGDLVYSDLAFDTAREAQDDAGKCSDYDAQEFDILEVHVVKKARAMHSVAMEVK